MIKKNVEMRLTYAVALLSLAGVLSGCASDSSDTAATTDTSVAPMADPSASGPSGAMPGVPTPAAAGGTGTAGGRTGANTAQAGAPASNSWESVARQIPGFAAPAGGA
ncbi:MAG: hypothetical protein ACOVT5_06635, partial [Armatimonadaceae bacterium]